MVTGTPSGSTRTSRPQDGIADGSDEPVVLLTVEEAARLLRVGRNTCYELIRQHRVPHVRLGRLIRVPRFGLEAWIARESALADEPGPVVSFTPQRH